jgi:hypothetical protein
MAAIVAAFQGAGARVVVGSPGCVGRIPDWAKDNHASAEQMNRNLCALRNIDIELAASTASRFADVFWPMLNAMVSAHERYGADYAVPGKDGVHPDWSGQVIMAYAFLKALGFDGDLGTVTMDLGADRAEATGGHQVMSCAKGAVTIRSPRYPFCSIGTSDRDNSIRSGMTLVPFNQDLNRFVLIVKSVPTVEARVTWGGATKQFSASQLAAGVNLAEAFQVNPFSEAFAAVDAAVAAKQEYETRQIKTLFHGPEGRVDMEGTVALTERTREPLAKAVSTAFVPVTHTIRIEPVSP